MTATGAMTMKYQMNMRDAELRGFQKGYEIGYARGYEIGYKIGYARGYEIGMRRSQVKIARRMLARGMSVELTVCATGLEVAQAIKLRDKGEAD